MTPQDGVMFSVIIPTYNRPQPLAQCLKALASQELPRERYEVIVVDDGGSAVLEPVIAAVSSRLNITLLRQDNAGPAAARNTGAAQARGHYLAFTDDDCAPQPGWLSAFAAQFEQTPDNLLGGKTINVLTGNPFSAASQYLIDMLYQHFNEQPGSATFFASNNMTMPRSIFHRLGGFNTSFPLSAGEDRDFCDHWLYQGQRMTYVPMARLDHAHMLTLRKFWKQHFNYGRGAVTYHRLRALRGSGSFKIDPGFHFNLRHWFIQPVRQTRQWYRWFMPLLLIFSQFANLSGFIYERNRLRHAGETVEVQRVIPDGKSVAKGQYQKAE
jgi:glycosyltransferase involved in cell wall biosynthesis